MAFETGEPHPLKGPSRWARIRANEFCKSCKAPLPINRPEQALVCPNCYEPAEVTSKELGSYLSWVGDDQVFLDGVFVSSAGRAKARFTRAAPRCERCRAELPIVPIGTTATLACPSCAKPYETFPVPPELAELAGPAKQVYCEPMVGWIPLP